jgi:hypothetical protein
LAKQKNWREEDAAELSQKHDLLSMLDKQSEDWLTPANIDEKLETQMNTILPPTILSHVDYYNKINRYAELIEQGFTEEAEKLKLNKKIIDYKNKQLEPLYHELKTLIKHLTYTEESSVFDLYIETVNRLRYHFENHQGIEPIVEHFNGLFKKLITLIRMEYENPNSKLELIESQLKSLVMILVVWIRYVEIIYMTDEEVQKILDMEANPNQQKPLREKTLDEIMEEGDAKELKSYYFNQITEKKTKGKGLFLNDFKDFYDKSGLRERVINSEKTERVEDEDYTTYDSDLEESEILAKKKERREKIEKNKNLLEHDAKFKHSGGESSGAASKAQIANKQKKRKLIESELEEVFEEKKPTEDMVKGEKGEAIKLHNDKAVIDNDVKINPTEEEKQEAKQTENKEKKRFFETYMAMRTKEIIRGKILFNIKMKAFRDSTLNNNMRIIKHSF